MIRFGLCCIFKNQPIGFRRKTAASLKGLPRSRQLELLAEICLANARSLKAALEYCHEQGIGDFRINSQILPLATHPEAGYRLEDLPGSRQSSPPSGAAASSAAGTACAPLFTPTSSCCSTRPRRM